MEPTRRQALAALAATTMAQAQSGPVRYVRFRKGSTESYGILDGETVREIRGGLFGARTATNTRHKLGDVKLLYPVVAPKVFAVGLNYRSHLGTRTPPTRPEMFYKPTTCLQHPGDPIVIPRESKNLHYEGEFVLVIGKRASKLSEAAARDAIFGVSCGNDVSERDWQNGSDKDLQWWRAKGADTFGPLGPCVVTGLDYSNLKLQTRLNGKVVQEQTTADLLFGPARIVSFISQYVTLEQGDLIYTGTPGSTAKMSPGDTVEIEIEGIGILRNPVTQG